MVWYCCCDDGDDDGGNNDGNYGDGNVDNSVDLMG